MDKAKMLLLLVQSRNRRLISVDNAVPVPSHNNPSPTQEIRWAVRCKRFG